MTEQLFTNTAHTDATWFGAARETANFPVVARFTIDGEPQSKARARVGKTRNGRSFSYSPKANKEAEAKIGWLFRAAAPRHRVVKDQTFGVTAIFFHATHQRRDVDNMLKLVLDGLNGVAWEDDSNVTEVTGRKVYVHDKGHARTEVLIYSLHKVDRMTKDCEQCGQKFDVYPSTEHITRFCSLDCAYGNRRQLRERTCECCTKTFLAHGPQRETRFCSQKCRVEFGWTTIDCKICKTPFRQRKSWIEQRPYCSKECVLENARQKARERRTKKLPGVCRICGAGTTRKEYRRCNPCKLAGKHAPPELIDQHVNF